MIKTKLMVPGPVEVDHDVMEEMSRPQIAHYDEEAINLYNRCTEKLKELINEKNLDPYIMVGSGSASMDACIGSSVTKGDKVLVASNGNFGDRLKTQSRCFGAEVVELNVEPGKAIRGDMIEDAINKNNNIKAILIVHLETTNGVLNPIDEIGEAAKRYNIPLLVDTVSSFGVEQFKMSDWGVGLSGTGVQKGLETPPGLGIVMVSPEGWKVIENASSSSCGWYMNLLTWRDFAKNNRVRKDVIYPLMVTMPVNNIRALHKSLENICEEGIENRLKRHRYISEIVRTGLLNLGFEVFPEKGFSAHAVTAMKNTLNIDISEMIDFIKRRYNTTISNGLFNLHNKIFRIGHIGQTAHLDSVVPVMFGIEHFLRTKGFNIKSGASLIGIK